MTRVLLDINVILDLFLARLPWLDDAAAIFQWNHEGDIQAHVSAAALPTIFYVVRRNSSLQQAERVVDECLASLEVLPVDRAAIELARSLPGREFEDAVEIACAALGGLTAIVTRDPKGFAGSPVSVFSPAEFRKSVETHPPPGAP